MQAQHTGKTLSQLFWPVFFEYTLQMLVGVMDTVMLSMVSDQAVAASGTSNTYLYLVSMIFTIMSTGALTVMTQYIGAGQPGVAVKARRLGLLFNAAVGGAFSLLFAFGSHGVLALLDTSAVLIEDAATYMTMVGSTCILLAMTNVYSSYLRSFGLAGLTLVATGTANVVNIVLNGVFIACGWGIAGVALATMISRVVNLVLVMAFCARIRKKEFDRCDISNREIFRQIFKIGFPSAGELIVFNLSISFMVRCLNQMDAEGIAVGVYSYCNQICNLVYCAAVSLSQANGILVGWRVGEGDFEAGYRQTITSFKYGILVTGITAVVAALISRPVLGLLTDNQSILAFVFPIMCLNIVKELGRQGNYIIGTALKSSGDAAITVIMGLVCMPTCAVLGSYLLGLRLGWGIYGAWIGMTCDEGIRCLWMLARLRSRKWETKALIKKAAPPAV